MQKILENSEAIMNLNSKKNPINMCEKNFKDIVKELTEVEYNISKINKKELSWEDISEKHKLLIESLKIYNFFKDITDNNYKTENGINKLIYTQYTLAKRVDDIEEILGNLEFELEILRVGEENKEDYYKNINNISKPEVIEYFKFNNSIKKTIDFLSTPYTNEELNNSELFNEIDFLNELTTEINYYLQNFENENFLKEFSKILKEEIKIEEIFKNEEGNKEKEKIFLEKIKDFKNNIDKEESLYLLELFKLEYTNIYISMKILLLEKLSERFFNI